MRIVSVLVSTLAIFAVVNMLSPISAVEKTYRVSSSIVLIVFIGLISLVVLMIKKRKNKPLEKSNSSKQ